MRFASPALLLLLLLPLAGAIRAWLRRRRPPAARLAFPGLRFAAGLPRSARERFHALPALLLLLGSTALIVALARPQLAGEAEPTRVRSRNIILALDISSSMKATDFQPGNRLEVARTILRQFIQRRQGDLMGLVIFAGRAFLQAPLTTDVAVLDRLAERMEIGLLPDGTGIGTALTLGLNQLKNLQKNASVIVLITDGANNTGVPSPMQAAEAAHALGIRIHTIGLSSADTNSLALNGVWSFRSLAPRLTGKDEAALKEIAARSGGQYYKATDPQALEEIMSEIDPMERIEVTVSESRKYYELFPWFLGAGVVLLLLEAFLGATWLRSTT
jgi:Ca-activated chloride channel family protein